MKDVFTVGDMSLMVEAVMQSYISWKHTYADTRHEADLDVLNRYRSLLIKIEKLIGKTLISSTVPNSIEEALVALERRSAVDPPSEPVEEQTEEIELPNNVLDFAKRRKSD